MARFYLDADDASRHPELQPLLAIASVRVDDYVEAFQALVRSDFLARLTAGALEELRSGSSARRFVSASDTDWLLLRTERFSLGVRTSPRQAETFVGTQLGSSLLVALPNDVLLGFFGVGSADAELYRSAFERDQDVFRNDHRLELAGRRTVAAGSVLKLAAGEDVVRFSRVDPGVAVIELAMVLEQRRLVWSYHPETLRAQHAASASVEATRAEFAIELFERFGFRGAVPNLLALARSRPEHWIRWRALTTALRLDFEQALGGLRAATDDPHPHVRNAARATLANVERAQLAGEV